ncbi:3,4-dihydroxy-2-butanone-4-phosphate synthase [Prosthecomicrobium hirschii]|uniref:3,4-dihydroxy-2-butanone 4-phosphate synthase n=1 Tax=Prosthecodimorpha hirschii TaxID=665126 RepID=A0A0P6VU69_9HYPH|nr:3,4-dihydroxy-2-butanone-4-phosphate synthase [Prosthecomicrobium hirschii]KPL54804.1 3,4-dihydroxy-2-butanone 4-phosphate synthase [Prosthecomicrobium hirschii]MCW1840309.1 3,4-dihydroxy-2-butanone-4-phosphate synthase [Prosthecomicrobium hirschii]TPQ49392.1 3,4-dihydroxy-2-butanone-4-phosphate synthase [Prosthecomicrobium hirschii]
MRLDDFLAGRGESRSAFARRAGLSPAAVTALCNDPEVWIGRETAARIAEATGGAVTPNDFLGLSGRDRVFTEQIMSQERVAEAIRAFEKGEIVVVTDDDDRENEGDLIVAAVHATTEKMAFIIRHTSGIVCTPITREEARRLHLEPMVAVNDAPHSTAFTVSIDYRHGTTTGISAEERTATVRALANPNVGAGDFVRPGHIFPLVAREGGVLMRSGHTEAAVDLCRLAGLPQVGVISELVNDDGTVKRGAQVAEFARQHGLKTVSVADLIAYRQRNERLVEKIEDFEIDTPAGKAQAITFRTPFDPMHHLAVVFGDIRDGRAVPVRLHLESVVGDVFGPSRTLDLLMKRFAEKGRGVIVYLREGSVGVARSASRPRDGLKGVDGATHAPDEAEGHGSASIRAENWREIGLGAQILKALGVGSIHLISSKARRYVGLEGFGIEIEGTEAPEA